METWKILGITIISAIVLGCVGGMVIGKHQIKKMSGNFRPLLSIRERIIYSACILLGAGFILFGVFYDFPSRQNLENEQFITGGEEGIWREGMVVDGMENPGIEVFDGGIIATNGNYSLDDGAFVSDETGTDGNEEELNEGGNADTVSD